MPAARGINTMQVRIPSFEDIPTYWRFMMDRYEWHLLIMDCMSLIEYFDAGCKISLT